MLGLAAGGTARAHTGHTQRGGGVHPAPPSVHPLVLEDDACFAPHFEEVWQNQVQLLRQHRDKWDVVLLGYFEVIDPIPASPVQGVPLRTLGTKAGSFFGMHGYLVTRRGAAILREHAFPLEVQVDAYLLTLQQIGWLRLFLLDGPEIIHQCLGQTEPGIAHQFQPLVLTCPTPASVSSSHTWHVRALLVVLLGVTAWMVVRGWRHAPCVIPED